MIRLALAGVRHHWQVFAGLFVSIALSVAALHLVTAVVIEVPRAPAAASVVDEVTAAVPGDAVIVRVSPAARFPDSEVTWTACDRPLPASVERRVAALPAVAAVRRTEPVLCSPRDPDVRDTLIVTPRSGSPEALAATLRDRLADVPELQVAPASQVAAEAIQQRAARIADQLTAAVSGFGVLVPVAAVFIVASTASFSIMARRRDTALMRLSGASAPQAAALVVFESLTVAALAGIAGVAAGLAVSAGFLDQALRQFAADPPAVGGSAAAVLIAFAGGLGIAAIGSVTAAVRAARVRPIAVLKDDAAAHASAWLPRVAIVALAALALASLPVAEATGGNLFSLGFAAMILAMIAAVAAAPWIASGVTTVIAVTLRRTTNPALLLAGQGVDTDRRRATAMTASLGLTIGLTASLFAMVPMIATISWHAAADTIRFESVGTQPIASTPSLAVTRHVLHSPASWALDHSISTAGTELAALPRFVDVAAAGALTPASVLLSDFGLRLLRAEVGAPVILGLPDGSTATLTVAGTYPSSAPLPDAVVDAAALAGRVPATPATYWFLASPDALAGSGVAAEPAGAWLRSTVAATASTSEAMIMIGVPVGLALVAALNTLFMAAPGRRHELASLRRLGVGGHLFGVLVVEGVLFTVLGAVAGLLAATAVALRLDTSAFSAGVELDPGPVLWVGLAAVVLVTLANASLALRRDTARD